MVSKLSRDVNILRQEKLCCDVILQGQTVANLVSAPSSGDTDWIEHCKTLLSQIKDLQVSNLRISKAFRPLKDLKALRVTFASEASRSEVFSKFFKMKDKPFFINEVLIAEKANLFYKMRCLRRELAAQEKNYFKTIFSRHGEIFYILLNEPDKMHKITSLGAIQKLSDQLKQPENFTEQP